jgi:hypothetical protein
MNKLDQKDSGSNTLESRGLLFLSLLLGGILLVFSVIVVSGVVGQLFSPKADAKVTEILAKDVYGREKLFGYRRSRLRLGPEVPLTKYVAIVSYGDLLGNTYNKELPAKIILDHGAKFELARYKYGEIVRISYNKQEPGNAMLYDFPKLLWGFLYVVIVFPLIVGYIIFGLKVGNFLYIFKAIIFLVVFHLLGWIVQWDGPYYLITRETNTIRSYKTEVEKK